MRNIATYRINCKFCSEFDEALKGSTPEEALLGIVFRLHCPATTYERWWLEQYKAIYERRVAEHMLESLER